MSIARSLFAAALAAVALGSPALAQKDGPFYTAELTGPATENRAIVGGVVFSCEGTSCTASKGRDRPLRVCSELVRKVGPVAAFSAGGKPLDDAKLARCNG